MGRPRPIDRAEYIKMAEALRASGGNVAAAARATKLPLGKVRMAWEHGWPLQGHAAVKDSLPRAALDESIVARAAAWDDRGKRLRRAAEKEGEDAIIAQRQVERGWVSEAEMRARQIEADAKAKGESMVARAELEAKARLQEIIDSAKMDAAVAASEELQLVRNARGAAIALSKVMGFVLEGDGAKSVADAIKAVLAMPEGVEARDLVAMSKAVAGICRDMVQMSQMAIEMERQRLGTPVHVIGVQQVEGTVTDAEKAMVEANALLEAMRRSASEPTTPPTLTPDVSPVAVGGTSVH